MDDDNITWSGPSETTGSGGRREQILSAATRLFNRHSFAGMTLEAIADEIGIAQGTLYHYFENKDALIFQCHLRGIRLYAEELAGVMEPGIDGLETVRRFVRRRLLPGRPRMIAFSDVDALSLTYRQRIHQGRLNNVAVLQSIIERGVAEGGIAALDARLTSIALFSILDWMPFWYSERDYYSRQYAAETIDDLITHGLVRRDVPPPVALPEPPDLSRLTQAAANAGRRAAKRDRLLRVASESFNLRGVVGSSLEAIAEDAGVSRGAYYYHAPDKETLLYLCLQRALAWEVESARHLVNGLSTQPDDLSGVVELEIQLVRRIFLLHDSPLGPKSTYHNINYLKPAHKAEILAINRDAVGQDIARYRDWIAAGHYRPVDVYFAQQFGAGLRNNLAVWFYETRNWPTLVVADNAAHLFLFGLKARAAARTLT